MPTRQTPKIRLRHDNSQIQFEPIVSSPLNLFNQESQVLTERQREMTERQRLTTGLFANIGTVTSYPETMSSPIGGRSDALRAENLPNHTCRTTPMKSLAAIGPMDVFLGSSPTPQVRRSTQHIVSEDTNVATPTAVRTAQAVPNDDLGSSPPRFENDITLSVISVDDDIQVGSSLEYRQSDSLCSLSFNDGTTIDEEALLEAGGVEPGNNELSIDSVLSEVPSSTIDLQLTAQIDADMQGHVTTATQPRAEKSPGSELASSHVSSHRLPSQDDIDHGGSDAEVKDSQISPHAAAVSADRDTEVDTSSASCVGDSFVKPEMLLETPQTQNLRRSSRHSTTPSPALRASGKKRKQILAKAENKAMRDKKEATEEKNTTILELGKDPTLDNIVVVTSPKKKDLGRKRKSMCNDQPPVHDQVVVPRTSRNRGVLRSQSLLSQVESSQDILVEDTPAPKRAKMSVSQEVSETKNTPAPHSSQTKRLSHVQITSKKIPEVELVHNSEDVVEVENATSTIAEESTNSPPRLAATKQPSRETSLSQQAAVGSSTPSRSFTERVILTPRSIINQLRNLKDYLFSAPQLMLGREEEREIDDALFDIRRQVHAAGRRSDERGRGE